MIRLLKPTIGICLALIVNPLNGTLLNGAITAAKPLIEPPGVTQDGKEMVPEASAEPLAPEVVGRNAQLDSILTPSPDKPTGMRPELKGKTIRTHYENGNLESKREVHTTESGNTINHGKFQLWDNQGGLIATGYYQNGPEGAMVVHRQGPGVAPTSCRKTIQSKTP